MPPFQGGGEMIKEVSFEKTTFNDLPYKFEAGTPNIADTIAFKSAIAFYSIQSEKKKSASMNRTCWNMPPGTGKNSGLADHWKGKRKSKCDFICY